MGDQPTCELCKRERITTFHHLVPKKSHKRSRVTKMHTKMYMNSVGVNLCNDCHKYVHKMYDHMTLALEYYTLELLQGSEELMKFVNWVKNQTKKAKI